MRTHARWSLLLPLLLFIGCSDVDRLTAPPATPRFSHTPAPTSVTVAGSLQSELGCAGDWQPECTGTELAWDANDQVWQRAFNVPAGSYEYKAVLNGSWTENYGANATGGGSNIALSLAEATAVRFYYDHQTHWITDDRNSVIVTTAGSHQSELGCAGDWDPGCLRSWLQDPDGDGTYSLSTTALPAGNYETKVAIAESWTENYGAGGVQNGANIPFTVEQEGDVVAFSYNATTHVLVITVIPATMSVTLVGNFQTELECAGDWEPACGATGLAWDEEDGVYQRAFALPAGYWEYKVALDGSWTENYGANAQPGGSNIPLDLAAPATVKFYYHPATHWITSSRNAVIVTAAGSHQSELGCNGDWDPQCLRSWLQDTDGDGIYTFTTSALPAGNYETKAVIDESWVENYGAGGEPGGSNIPFSVAAGEHVTFRYDATTHVLTITADAAPAVSGTTPANGAVDVARGANLTVTFSEPVNVAGGWFAIVCGSVGVTAAASGGPTTYTLDPDVVLPAATSCTVTIHAASVSDQDATDPPDGMVENYSWTFVTASVAEEKFDAAEALIVALVADEGIENSLLAKLGTAYAYWQADDQARACGALKALLKEISALKGKKKLSNADAGQLTAAVEELRVAVGC